MYMWERRSSRCVLWKLQGQMTFLYVMPDEARMCVCVCVCVHMRAMPYQGRPTAIQLLRQHRRYLPCLQRPEACAEIIIHGIQTQTHTHPKYTMYTQVHAAHTCRAHTLDHTHLTTHTHTHLNTHT